MSKIFIGNERIAKFSDITGGKFDTVADMKAANLPVGAVVETSGFYSVNDGGGAKYQIQSTGTANEMDLIAVAGGKIAKVLLLSDCYPEQLGYKEYSSSHDLTTYIHRAIDIGIHTIKFYGKTYYQFTPMNLTSKQGIQLLGNHCFGSHGNITEIAYRPSTDDTTAITIATRGFRIENIYLGVTAAPGSSETKSANGISCGGYDDYNKYKWAFKNIRLNSFDTCLRFLGNIKWNVVLDEIVFNFCNIGLELYESSLCIECHQIHTNSCKLGVKVSGDTYGLSFYNCNFGSIERAIEITKISSHIYQSINFVGCSFEIDDVSATDLSAVFVKVENDIYTTLNFIGCNFTLTKASLTTLPDDLRCIKLGNSSRATFIQCEVLDNLSEYANLDKMFDENSLPANEYGSVSVIGSHKLVVPSTYGYRYCKLNGETRITNKQPTSGETLDDCNNLVPTENGTSIWCDVNSFGGTANLPSGLSGFGKLEATLMIGGSRVAQQLMASNNTIYYRRGSVTNGVVSWQGWYKIAMTAV